MFYMSRCQVCSSYPTCTHFSCQNTMTPTKYFVILVPVSKLSLLFVVWPNFTIWYSYWFIDIIGLVTLELNASCEAIHATLITYQRKTRWSLWVPIIQFYNLTIGRGTTGEHQLGYANLPTFYQLNYVHYLLNDNPDMFETVGNIHITYNALINVQTCANTCTNIKKNEHNACRHKSSNKYIIMILFMSDNF